ncbi:MAG: phospholipid carrier-dependent glycosyltransferase [Opitutus sp.]|nr:phospholipid carrier-dependent glycosyltransferase [Opitutus sp.]
MPRLATHWLPLVVVTALGLWLRVHDLDVRPMHADEANQAVKAGLLLQGDGYALDARDHHGPTLYYAAVSLAWIRDETTLAQLSETTVRLVPALFGTLAIPLLFLLLTSACPPSPRTPVFALAGASLLALSPPAVYYSRYFIQETLLLTFFLGAVVSAQRWHRSRQIGWAIAPGVCVGLMLSTKASAPLFLAAALVAAFAGGFRFSRDLTRPALAAGAAALIVFVLFNASFGANRGGVIDAFRAYGFGAARATGESGHEKPWTCYAQLFLWQRNGGLVFHQLIFTSLALVGIATAFRPRNDSTPLIRTTVVYLLLVFAAFSFTPYKTPWHAIHFVPPLAILAASACVLIPRWWWVAPMFGAMCATLWPQTRLVAFQRPSDARNPYAYVHSSPDVKKFRALAESALDGHPEQPIFVIGEEYWPIPWYLRSVPNVGYWPEPPAQIDGALVIATQTYAPAVRDRLRGNYRERILGLRPGVLCIAFVRE